MHATLPTLPQHPDLPVTTVQQAVSAAPTRWRDFARCLGRWGLVDAVEGSEAMEALRLCDGCPVIEQCASWVATERDYEGVAAGAIHTPPSYPPPAPRRGMRPRIRGRLIFTGPNASEESTTGA